MTNMLDLRERLADPKTRTAAAIEFGDWMRGLCLLLGSEVKTACKVGAVAAFGIEHEWSKGEPQP